MADRWAVATGNWSDTATWDGGTLPGTTDDVYADGRTITINQDITVASIRTDQRAGGTTGGTFNCSSARTINANIVAGTGVGLNVTTAAVNINGNITGGTGTNCHGVAVGASAGTFTVIGNITGGTGSTADGIRRTSVGTINITGNVTAGDNGAGVRFTTTCTVTVTGNVYGGSVNVSNSIGIITSGTATSTLTINGNVYGGTGGNLSRGITWNHSGGGGNLYVNGNIYGDVAEAIANQQAGTVTIKGDIYGGASNSAFSNSATGIFIAQGYLYAHANGYAAINGKILVAASGDSQWKQRGNNAGAAGAERIFRPNEYRGT